MAQGGQGEWVWFEGNQYGDKETLTDVAAPFSGAVMDKEEFIANLTNISDRTPSIIREQIEEYKYEWDEMGMDWLLDYLEGTDYLYVGFFSINLFFVNII